MEISLLCFIFITPFSQGYLEVGIEPRPILRLKDLDSANVLCHINGSYDLVEIKVDSLIIFSANRFLKKCSLSENIVTVTCCDFPQNRFCLRLSNLSHGSIIKCKAVKGRTTSISTTTVNIQVSVKSLILRPSGHIIDVQVGNYLQFNCCTSPSRPLPSISWHIGDREIFHNVTISTEQYKNHTFTLCSTLDVKSRRIMQGMILQCRSFLNFLEDKPQSQRRSINILYPPSVEVNFKHREVMLGETGINLRCRLLDSNPTTNVIFQWTCENGIVINSSILIIDKVERGHSGQCLCRAKNSIGWSAPVNATIKVMILPSVKVSKDEYSVHLGDENVTLECSVNYTEPSLELEYEWTKDSVVLGRSPLYFIKTVDRSSAGIYKCIVESRVGRSAPALLRVSIRDLYVDIEGGYETNAEGNKHLEVKCSIKNSDKFRAVTSMEIIKNSLRSSVTLLTINEYGNISINVKVMRGHNKPHISGNIANPAIAFLTLKILDESIVCPDDFTDYFCRCVGVDKSSSPIRDQTKRLEILYDEPPGYMSDIQVKIKGRMRTSNESLPAGTRIELTCEGDVTHFEYKLQNIRWCLKIGSYGNFTHWVAHTETKNITSKSCYKMQRSTIVYTVEITNGLTEFICESGYKIACGTGSALSHIYVKSEPQKNDMLTPFFFISLSILLSAIVGLVINLAVFGIKRKLTRALPKENRSTCSYGQETDKTIMQEYECKVDSDKKPTPTRRSSHDYDTIEGYTEATWVPDNKKGISQCHIL